MGDVVAGPGRAAPGHTDLVPRFRGARAVIALGLLAAILSAAQTWWGDLAAESLRSRELELVRQAHQLESAAARIPGGARGFLVTGDQLFVDDLARDRTVARAALVRLRELVTTSESRQLLERVDRELEQTIAGVERRVGLAQAGRIEEARTETLAATAQQRQLFALVEELVSREESLLALSLDVLRRQRWVALAISAGLLAGAGALAIALLVRGERAVERSQREASQIADEHADLLARLRIALEAGQMGAWEWEPSRGRVVWSPEVEVLYGLVPGAFDGSFETYMSLIHPEDRAAAAAAVAEASKRGGDFQTEHRVIWPDGTIRWVAGRGRAQVDGAGQLVRMTGTVIDVTGQRELERQKDEFLSSAAHDLKNPLGAIKGNAQLMLRLASRENVPPRLVDGLSEIDAATTRMTALIDDLLDLSRLQMGHSLDLHLQPTDLVALSRRVVSEHDRAAERHEIRVESDEEGLVGSWDAPRLARVLGNLVSNAIKYSPDGGAIVVRLTEAHGTAVVVVQDSGIGIPPADLPHVFERFRRGSNVDGLIGGTGIGLASARQIVEAHGGTIEVESAERAGSTFTVRLPLGAEKGVAESATPSRED